MKIIFFHLPIFIMFSLLIIFSLNFYWFYKVFFPIIGVTIEEVNIISPPGQNIQNAATFSHAIYK